ncbi:MAG: aspartate/glutamate racemase family protein [Stappiaceae bacterium]
MHIGLIGGIGPAATDLYYRGLINVMKAADAPLDLTIVHADAPTLVRNFEARTPEPQAEIFLNLTERLVKAGAQAVAITSIGGHFCVDEFRTKCPLPIIDLIDVMNEHLASNDIRHAGILGTDTAMKTRFYGGVKSTEILIPQEADIERVHRAYVDMALSVKVTEEQRRTFFDAGREMTDRGAEVILLGGTDLFLAFDDHDPGFATLDCAQVHIEAIAAMAQSTP